MEGLFAGPGRGGLLLDEPFGALDARVRKELRGWLRRLRLMTRREVELAVGGDGI